MKTYALIVYLSGFALVIGGFFRPELFFSGMYLILLGKIYHLEEQVKELSGPKES